MSDRIKNLLHEVADGVEPGDRLDAIRSATSSGRRTARGWWAAGGAGLIAASVVTALALTTGGAPQSEPDPDSPTATDPTTRGGGLEAWVYYVGDTPDGQRLYRELRRTSGETVFAAAEDGLRLAPLDPDYVNLWPADAITDVSFDGVGSEGIISITVDPAYRQRRRAMTAAEAGLAVEQVIRTFQAATDSTAAVQFRAGDNPIDQVLGVPTSEPLAAGDIFSTLALVSLSEPAEGQVVDNDEPFTVTGLGNSFEGNIVTRLLRPDGTEVTDPVPTIAGFGPDRLFPYEVALDLSAVPPGDYVVLSQTDDPSGEGRFHTDSRQITVVD